MKGKMTITVDEKKINCQGSILFRDELEPYLVLHSAAKCLGITTIEQFARLALISTLHKDSEKDQFERTEYVIPKKRDSDEEN